MGGESGAIGNLNVEMTLDDGSDEASLMQDAYDLIKQDPTVAASRISCGSTLIAMMQTADLREGNNVACGGKLHATRPWAVLVEREMRSGVMMILKTTSHQLSIMRRRLW